VIQSAGLLLFRRKQDSVEVLLVHPGGPFWAKKDDQAWSIPKGEFPEDEDPLAAARREFEEETGFRPDGNPVPLGSKKTGGKTIHVWAMEADWDSSALRSDSFSMEWPPKSGETKHFPEVDRAAWFDLPTARHKIHRNQLHFIETLETRLT
jgi:predicted NUDIX family NTP pyrophosphohydrolase